MASANPTAGSGVGDASPTGAGPATNAKARKRTKTGCLTCRKRRIKCGEERPTCANCIKSKRQCEGYNQRLVFKPPIGDWPNNLGVVSTLQYHNSSLPGTRTTNYQPHHASSQPPETLTSIQPRPLTHFEYQRENTPSLAHLNTQQPYPGNVQSYGQDGNFGQPLQSPQHQQPLQSPHHQLPTPTSATSYLSQPSPVHASFQGQFAQNTPRYAPNQYPSSHEQSYYPYGSHSQAPLQQPQVTSANYSQAEAYSLAPAQPDPSHSSYNHVQIPPHDVSSQVAYMPQHAVYEPTATHAPTDQTQIPLNDVDGEDHVSPTQVLDEAAVEQVDDDYWDVESDEEMAETPARNEEEEALDRDFSLIRRIHHQNTNELAIRRYDAFIYEGILSNYKAENVANPLKNPKTARVFAHFIHVTGPTLSIYERHPRNTTFMFEGQIPPSQQNLWSYTLPLKALNHQGLLHAMLALASLHIARLQRASITPSYKHYAYALKRLGRALSNPKRRNSIATLATSLLLGFYEVMSAEHSKWSTHVVGAAQLLSELDFPALTREARRLQAAQDDQERRFLADLGQPELPMNGRMMMPDEGIVSIIVGKKVSYEKYGRVLEHADEAQETLPPLPEKLDMRGHEVLQDLRWWYSRQDAFQSIISGNPLITPFRKWTDCPPRAPIARADATFGTQDHILLLIARICDFATRDRSRKLKQVEANGGKWRPSPNMPGGMPMGPPGAGRGGPAPAQPMRPPPHLQTPSQQGQTAGGPPPMPAFYGMAPTLGPTPLSKRYAAPEGVAFKSSPPTTNAPHPKFADLPAALEAAEEEWEDISRAHATIASAMASNDAFAPLTEDLYPVAPGGNMSPFGPVLVHRSYDISTLWLLLHCSKIFLMRSHPAMPPAATISAGVAAPATKPYAILIGRICAGMQVPASDDLPLSPFLGAALTESTMGLFFAGVQYQEAAQRAWLVKRLLDIDRRTGWASAAAIARSCETAWERAAAAGRGPPYVGRKTRPYGEEGQVVLDGEGREGRQWGGSGVKGSRRLVVARVQVPWAKNLLASEEELRAELESVKLEEK